MHHIVTTPCILHQSTYQIGTCISYLKSKNKIYTVDRAATGKTLCFCFLTYGSRTANRMDSLYQTVNGIVGNVEWGESLVVVSCEFPGLNSFGARRRASSAWLAKETRFPKIIPPVIVLRVCDEKVMYKYQLQRKKEEKENTKYTVLDEIKENEAPKAPENQE